MEWYKNYDALIQRICPDYEQGIDALVKGIPTDAKNILEIGAGTGNLTAKIAHAFPNVNITAIDKDPQMLEVAAEKVKANPNVELLNQAAENTGYSGIDTVVSSLVFRMMPDKTREKVFHRMYDAGVQTIVVFDRIKGEPKQREKAYLEYFATRLKGQGLPLALRNQLMRESRRNNPFNFRELRSQFKEAGYRTYLLWDSGVHGFMVYHALTPERAKRYDEAVAAKNRKELQEYLERGRLQDYRYLVTLR